LSDGKNTLLVTTPSALADEMSKELNKSRSGRYLIFSIGDFPLGNVPPGSRKVLLPTYSTFLRFVDASNVGEVFFAAKLSVSPFLWMQALLDPRVLFPILRGEARPTANFLLEAVVDKDLEARGIEIGHPHRLGPAFKLTGGDQVDNFRGDIANKLRVFPLKPLPDSATIVPESRILGLTEKGELEVIATEARGTDQLLSSLKRKRLDRYQRIILHKVTADKTQISYPVIGVKTVEMCSDYGVTDIFLDRDGVVQGKDEMVRLARSCRISLRSMQEA
jgi:hypothetical protein